MSSGYRPVTLGKKVKSLNLGRFVLTEAIYPPDMVLPRHAHECATISWVISGSCTETYGNTLYECRPYEVQLKPAGETHSNQYGRKGARCLFIEVKPHLLKNIYSLTQIFARPALLQDSLLSALAMRIYRECRTKDDSMRLIVEGLVLELLGQIERSRESRNADQPPHWLREARELIEQSFTESIGLFDIATAVGVNRTRLADMFRKHYQCTVGDYVRRLRLELAAKELISSGKTLAGIAQATGFYDQSHLNRIFKLHMGMTPSAYRAAARMKKSDTKSL